MQDVQAIEVEALTNYEKNLEYFSKNKPDIFRKLQLFDMGLSHHDIVPKYDLEYKDEGYFDVKNLRSNSYLYDRDSIKYAQKSAAAINYKKDALVFNGILDYNVPDAQIKALKEAKSQRQQRIDGSSIKEILPIMHYAMKLAPKDTTMKKIDKFIFIGTGLGTHIVQIAQKVKASEYLIIEDDLELFRLSLFTTPYYALVKSANLYFSVGQNENDFTITMGGYLEGSFFNNRYLKYFHFPAHSTHKIKLIQNSLAAQTHLTFPYDIQLDKYLRPLARMKEGYKTIDVSKKFPTSIFSQKPVLLLAAGPSMKKNLPWIAKNQDKFILVAVSAVLKTLHEHQITPDIVTHIDGIETEGNSCMVHFEGFDVGAFLEDTLFIFGPHTPESLLAMLNKENIFFYENFTFYYNNFGSITAPCIGSTSILLALQLNAKALYLLGIDLALDQVTGQTHTDDHEYNDTHDLSNSDEIDYNISLRNNIIPIKGNLREKVYSTPLFQVSVQSLFKNIPSLKDDFQKVYNLNDGAYLEQTIPTKIDEVNIAQYTAFDKALLHEALSRLLETKSQTYLDKEDTASLKRRLKNAQKVMKDFKAYEKKHFSNEDQYLYDLLGVVSSTLKLHGREGNNLALVFSSYFQYVLPYIIDIINTKEVTKVMKHLKKIDKMFIEGAYTILNTYIEDIKVFLK
ncbi:MAG: DUF115 domain-containing protein [Epsilonproteobacteria bacterium]|nr:DUF115 domain-containing protein [Campylobacterota bacterium]